MNTEQLSIRVRDIDVEVIRKDIKNLHIGVYPPDGKVRAASPRHLDDEAIRLAVVSRLPWIRKQQKAFAQQERQSRRDMVTGETHFYLGSKFRLDVVEENGTNKIKLINNDKLQMKIRPGTGIEKRRALLQNWYRNRLKEQIPDLKKKWEKQLEVEASEVRIRAMKTRWGSCNTEARRIWLNLELIKKPVDCIEYILVHEMIHFFERHHTDRFRKLMDHYMPDWRTRRDRLNQAPLAHEDWKY